MELIEVKNQVYLIFYRKAILWFGIGNGDDQLTDGHTHGHVHGQNDAGDHSGQVASGITTPFRANTPA